MRGVPICGTTKGTTNGNNKREQQKGTAKGNDKREQKKERYVHNEFCSIIKLTVSIIIITRVPFCGTFCSSIRNQKKEQLARF